MSQWSRRHFGERFNAEEFGGRGGILLAAAIVAALVLEAAPPQDNPKKYEATRKSLASRPAPQWFNQAKFGIFIVWGPYSVPAFAPKGRYAEWYWHRVMNARKTNDLADEFLKFHDRVYGSQFRYEDFVPLFRAEMFNPDQWIDLIVRSGAKYVVHSAKYHDGFCLWPSQEADRSWGRPWNSVTAGPRRDLVGELEQAGRARGLKMGLYYSLYEWYNPLYLSDFARYRDQHHFPQFKDMVTRYKPAIIFADGQWEHSFEEWRSADLLAWLFNESACREEVAVNDRWGGKRAIEGIGPGEVVVGYRTSEYERGFDASAGPWEENRGIGASYGYNRNEDASDYRSAGQLIRLLVETASKGGNLLLDIGPTADGRIPEIMQDRLIEMGQWLQANGEAIYGANAGPIRPADKGALADIGGPDHSLSPAQEAQLNKARPWACTAKPGRLFIHVFESLSSGRLDLPPLKGKVRRAYLLDGKTPVRATQTSARVMLELPKCLPDPRATVVVLEME